MMVGIPNRGWVGLKAEISRRVDPTGRNLSDVARCGHEHEAEDDDDGDEHKE